ncbi:hypothetical protein ACOI1C_21135 [Bacillus sp. DJP31]|uniref:hypothetical protein n=1 Tax=Bacillus sp. DJP31 TaxID=3409789 RepID=UPI003BB6C7BF
MSLKTVATLSILFISIGFVLFLVSLFTQSFNWLPAILTFSLGMILFFVARRLSNLHANRN